MSNTVPDYGYDLPGAGGASGYLWPAAQKIIQSRVPVDARSGSKVRVLDLGCGNGSTCNFLSELGYQATGIDPSQSGVDIARRTYAHCRFEIGNAYENLAARLGQFPVVISLEVVEHCYDPNTFSKTLFDLVEPGGIAIVSTPYHGYFKNLALAISGKFDRHFTALWHGGHIKFFSIETLGTLLRSSGFVDIDFVRVGRIPVVAKSMIAIAKRPRAP